MGWTEANEISGGQRQAMKYVYTPPIPKTLRSAPRYVTFR